MQKIIGFILLICCVFALYSWTFESESVVISGAGEAVSKDVYGNNIDKNGFVVPDYYDDKLSGEFYDAASKPLGFINSIASAFDGFRDGIVDMISSAGSLSETLRGIFNFNDSDSWWNKLLNKGV